MVDNNSSTHISGDQKNNLMQEGSSGTFYKLLVHSAKYSSSIQLLFDSAIKELQGKYRAFPSLLKAAKLAQTITSKNIQSNTILMSHIRHVPKIYLEHSNRIPSSHTIDGDIRKYKLQNIMKKKVYLEQRDFNESRDEIPNTIITSQPNSTRKAVYTKELINNIGRSKTNNFLLENSKKRYKIISATKPMKEILESNSKERRHDNSFLNLNKYSANKSFIKKEHVQNLDSSVNRSPSMDKKEYLYQKLEERYNRESLLPILEKRKIELAKKRNYFKPVTQEEIKEHQKKYDEFIQQRKAEKISEINKRKIEDEIFSAKVQQFKTDVSLKYFCMDQEEKEKKEKRMNEQKLLREKIGELCKFTLWLLWLLKKCDLSMN